jgi:hypothetical protein
MDVIHGEGCWHVRGKGVYPFGRKQGDISMKPKNGRRCQPSDLFAGPLVRTAAMAVVLAWSTGSYAGSEGEIATQSVGLLTFETGTTDRFALYPNGEFQNPARTNPPEDVVDQASPNQCQLAQPDIPDDLLNLTQEGGHDVGFRFDSLGVFSRGGGNARGVRCIRISDDERLILTLGSDAQDPDPNLSTVVAKTHLDVEFKGNAIGVFTAKFDGAITGRFFARSGTSAVGPPPAGLAGAIEIPCGATGQDSNNDSGPNDNCPIQFPFDNPDPQPDIPAAFWDTLELEVWEGTGDISLEGGGDYGVDPEPFFHRTEFELLTIGGLLNCGEQVIGRFGDASATVFRAIENVGGGCPDLIAFLLGYDPETVTFQYDYFDPTQQRPGHGFRFNWPMEPVTDLTTGLPTANLLSILSLTDQVDCTNLPIPSNPPGPPWTRTCIGLATCVGQPYRVCSDFGADGIPGPNPDNDDIDDDVLCETDDQCVLSGEGLECVLINLEPPDGGFPDLVDNNRCELSYAACATDADCPTEGDRCVLEADEYGCSFFSADTYLGSKFCSETMSQACNVDADCPASETCVDSGTDKTRKIEGIFLPDDARISRGR